MRIVYILLGVLFLWPSEGNAQEARVSKKEARMIERGLKRKEKKNSKFRELNEFGIDIYATNVIQAIRRHLGTAKIEGNKVIVMRDRIGSFTIYNKSKIYILKEINKIKKNIKILYS